jgi:hypothetical protein
MSETQSMSRKVDQLFTRGMLHHLNLIVFLIRCFPGPQTRVSKNRAGIVIPPPFVADKSRLLGFGVSEADFIHLETTMAYFAEA